MKELYSFSVKRKVESEVPYVKKTKDGPVESTKKVKKTIKNRVVFSKPTVSDREDAEFFYGQKFNEFINAGFLTKAMLAKKMGDLGGFTSKKTSEIMTDTVLENIEASRTIEFFEGGEDLSQEQKEQLKEAKRSFAETKREIYDYEESLRGQFSQTADAKAEHKLIEWLVLNFSFFEEEVGGKTELFPMFDGDSYEMKRGQLLSLQEKEESEEKSANSLKREKIYAESFTTLIRVASIWYNQLGNDQKSIDQTIKDLFEEEEALFGEEDDGNKPK
jgi:hypothetical protein